MSTKLFPADGGMNMTTNAKQWVQKFLSAKTIQERFRIGGQAVKDLNLADGKAFEALVAEQETLAYERWQRENPMTINQALENALEFLESLGYKSGDIHDDLALAASRIRMKYPTAAKDAL